MKKYIFTDQDKTWWAEYRVDGMLNSDNQTVLQISSKNAAGVISTTDLDPAMVTIGLPDKVGYRFTEVEFKALAVAKNLNLTKQFLGSEDATLYAALTPQTTPTFNPVAGSVAWGSTITIASASADAIYYTLDGTVPTTASANQATTPCVVGDGASIVRAIAVKSGKYQSLVGQAIYTQAAAAAPTNAVLAVGTSNPVGGVTNVAIPAAGATDETGAITGWVTNTADEIKFTVTDAANTTSTIKINGVAYTSGDEYTIAAAEDLTVVVTTTRENYATTVRTFIISVAPTA